MDPRIARALAEAFGVDPASVSEDTSPKTLPSWDSLGHLNLVAALEKAFGISLTMDEILAMQDVGCIARVLSGKGGGSPA